jgi:hypothetical protein
LIYPSMVFCALFLSFLLLGVSGAGILGVDEIRSGRCIKKEVDKKEEDREIRRVQSSLCTIKWSFARRSKRDKKRNSRPA